MSARDEISVTVRLSTEDLAELLAFVEHERSWFPRLRTPSVWAFVVGIAGIAAVSSFRLTGIGEGVDVARNGSLLVEAVAAWLAAWGGLYLVGWGAFALAMRFDAWRFRRRIDRVSGDTRWVFGAETVALECSSDGRRATYGWSRFERAAEVGAGYVLILDGVAELIPRRFLANNADERRFRELLRATLPTKLSAWSPEKVVRTSLAGPPPRSSEPPPPERTGPLRFSVALTPDERAQLYSRQVLRSPRFHLALVGLSAAITGMTFFQPRGGVSPAIVLPVTYAALFALAWVRNWWGARRAAADALPPPVQIALGETTIRIESVDSTTEVAWSAIERVDEVPLGFLVGASFGTIVIPRRTIPDIEVESALRALLWEKLGVRASLVGRSSRSWDRRGQRSPGL